MLKRLVISDAASLKPKMKQTFIQHYTFHDNVKRTGRRVPSINPRGHFDSVIDSCVFPRAFLKIAAVVNCIYKLAQQSEKAITLGRSLNMFQETQEEHGN